MAVWDPGTRAWTETLRAAAAARGMTVPPGTGIPLGGIIHDALIPATIKPGTREYLRRMRALAEGTTPPPPGDDARGVFEDGVFVDGVFQTDI